MIEKLEEYGRFLFVRTGIPGDAETEMTMQESLVYSAKSKLSYRTILHYQRITVFYHWDWYSELLIWKHFCCGSYILIAAWCDGADYTVPGRGYSFLTKEKSRQRCGGQEDPEAPGSASFTTRSGV